MNALLEPFVADPWGRLAFHYVVSGGMETVYLFLLVAARFSGLLIVAPNLTSIAVPYSVRIGLVAMLSLIVAPALSSSTNQTGGTILNAASNPGGHSSRRVDSGEKTGLAGTSPSASGNLKLAVATYESPRVSSASQLPLSVTEFTGGIASEVALGALFGVGLIAVFSGLRLSGEWLDRHSGLGLGTVFNPEWSVGGSACGTFAQLLGFAGLLLAEPIGGHLQILQSLLQSFREIPVGTSLSALSSIEFLTGVVQQCLILGIRVAMPLVAAMMLVDLTLALANRGATSAESSSYLVIRMGAAILVLAVTSRTVSGAIELAIEASVQLVCSL